MSDLLQLRSRFAAVVSYQGDVAVLIELCNERTSLSPWAAWLLVCLIRHHDRQQWLANIMKYRLAGEPETLANTGALQHPTPSRGVVPGEQHWEYRFHGIGFCLTHRVTGERIDVDFHDETADWIDLWFFQQYLESLSAPELPEQRLIQLHEHLQALKLGVQELLNVGAIIAIRDDLQSCFKLSESSLELVDWIAVLNRDIHDTARHGLWALAVQDWPCCKEYFAGTVIADRAEILAVKTRNHRESLLLERFHAGHDRELVLQALCDLNSKSLPSLLQMALLSPQGYLTSVALEIVETRPQQDWCEELFHLIQKLNPLADIPEPHQFIRCARYLLQRDFKKTSVCTLLACLQQRETGEGAILALEFYPSIARQLFQRALRSTIPCERTTAAATLAILDEPWGLDELIQALSETTDHDHNSSIRSALWASTHPQAHQAVLAWEELHPRTPEQGPWITMKEMSIRHADSWMNWEMQKLHERVLRLRGRVI